MTWWQGLMVLAGLSLWLGFMAHLAKGEESNKQERSLACFRAVEKLPEAARTSAFATCAALELEKK